MTLPAGLLDVKICDFFCKLIVEKDGFHLSMEGLWVEVG